MLCLLDIFPEYRPVALKLLFLCLFVGGAGFVFYNILLKVCSKKKVAFKERSLDNVWNWALDWDCSRLLSWEMLSPLVPVVCLLSYMASVACFFCVILPEELQKRANQKALEAKSALGPAPLFTHPAHPTRKKPPILFRNHTTKVYLGNTHIPPLTGHIHPSKRNKKLK